MKHRIIPLLVIACFTGCNPGHREAGEGSREPIEISGEFSISGAYAIYPLISLWADEFCAMHPGVGIDLQKQGTGQGLKLLQTGECDIAMVSSDMTFEEDTGYTIFAIAKDAVVPVVCSDNPYLEVILEKGLSHKQLQNLFSFDEKPSWGELFMIEGNEPVNVYTRTDESGASRIWSGFLFVDIEEMKGTGLKGDDMMVEKIMNDPYGIGYCNMIYIWDSAAEQIKPKLSVLPIDMNYNGRIDYKESIPKNIEGMRRHMQMGKYPHSLCRYLYLFIRPDNNNEALKAFLEYIMTDGQVFVEQAGYCKVPDYVLDCQVKRVRQGK